MSGKKKRNWKDKDIELLITLYENRACSWDKAHEDYMNRDKKEVAYCHLDAQMLDKKKLW